MLGYIKGKNVKVIINVFLRIGVAIIMAYLLTTVSFFVSSDVKVVLSKQIPVGVGTLYVYI